MPQKNKAAALPGWRCLFDDVAFGFGSFNYVEDF